MAMQKTSGTYAHSNSIAEQTVVTVTPTDDSLVWGIWLDTTNLTQDATIRLGYQIDGTTNRTFQTTNWTTGMDDGVLLDGLYAIDDSLQLSLQSSVLEGASRNVPYAIFHHVSSANVTASRGTNVHTNDTDEQTLLTLTPGTGEYNVNWGVWLDFVNLTQTVTIRLKNRIDGTNYRTFQTQTWTTGDEDGVLLSGSYASDEPIQISIQSSIVEGASRNIPYEVYYYPQEDVQVNLIYVDRSASSAKIYAGSGTLDYIDFQLRSSGVAINLSAVNRIEIVAIDKQGGKTIYSSSGGSPAISVIDGEAGKIRLTPTSTSFMDYLGPYKMHIWVYDTASLRYSVPENGFINMVVRRS